MGDEAMGIPQMGPALDRKDPVRNRNGHQFDGGTTREGYALCAWCCCHENDREAANKCPDAAVATYQNGISRWVRKRDFLEHEIDRLRRERDELVTALDERCAVVITSDAVEEATRIADERVILGRRYDDAVGKYLASEEEAKRLRAALTSAETRGRLEGLREAAEVNRRVWLWFTQRMITESKTCPDLEERLRILGGVVCGATECESAIRKLIEET